MLLSLSQLAARLSRGVGLDKLGVEAQVEMHTTVDQLILIALTLREILVDRQGVIGQFLLVAWEGPDAATAEIAEHLREEEGDTVDEEITDGTLYLRILHGEIPESLTDDQHICRFLGVGTLHDRALSLHIVVGNGGVECYAAGLEVGSWRKLLIFMK